MRAIPLLTARDVAGALALCVLAPIAWLVPPSRWGLLCAALGHARVRLRRLGISRAVVADALGGRPIALDPARIPARLSAHHVEAWLLALRAWRPGGFTPSARVEGFERLECALQAGRGVVLWVHRFRPLIHWPALALRGVRVARPSDADHGSFGSRCGVRILNAVQVIAELAWGERLVIAPGGLAHLRALARRLADNGVVAFYFDAPAGTRAVETPFLGGALPVAPRAASLAVETGASLLAVVPLGDGPGRFRVVLEEPLAVATAGRGRAAVDRLVEVHARLLEGYVLRHPGEWHGWWQVHPAGPEGEGRPPWGARGAISGPPELSDARARGAGYGGPAGRASSGPSAPRRAAP